MWPSHSLTLHRAFSVIPLSPHPQGGRHPPASYRGIQQLQVAQGWHPGQLRGGVLGAPLSIPAGSLFRACSEGQAGACVPVCLSASRPELGRLYRGSLPAAASTAAQQELPTLGIPSLASRTWATAQCHSSTFYH